MNYFTRTLVLACTELNVGMLQLSWSFKMTRMQALIEHFPIFHVFLIEVSDSKSECSIRKKNNKIILIALVLHNIDQNLSFVHSAFRISNPLHHVKLF